MKNDVEMITVKASGEYDVVIGEGILPLSGKLITEKIKPCKMAIVTDDTVDKLYSQIVIDSLSSLGFEVIKFVFKHGEQSKNLNTYGEILEFLAENELTRTDALVALGGGVVGDITGFVAATYLRGIRYVQIPTTLLSQVDSSVGGKTAIDLQKGKNLVGAFYQPTLVICDILALNTLPKEVFLDGMGEVAKYLLLDERIYSHVKTGSFDLKRLVFLCIDYKRRIVEEDEFESGKRRQLNLGHTPAHGIEKLSGYTISHGKAVAMGLKIMLDSSLSHGYVSKEEYDEILKALSKLIVIEQCPFDIKLVAKSALSDKKRSGDNIALMVVHGIGDVREQVVDVSELEGNLK